MIHSNNKHLAIYALQEILEVMCQLLIINIEFNQLIATFYFEFDEQDNKF